MIDRTNGFDWDRGNWPKCAQHGLTKSQIEQVLLSNPMLGIDKGNHGEPRYNAIAPLNERYVFVVFTLRERERGVLVRPISARYMHAKEVSRYVG